MVRRGTTGRPKFVCVIRRDDGFHGVSYFRFANLFSLEEGVFLVFEIPHLGQEGARHTIYLLLRTLKTLSTECTVQARHCA